LTFIQARVRPAPGRATGGDHVLGTKRRSNESVQLVDCRDSGAGTSDSIAIGRRSIDGSGRWKEASRFKIAPTAWRAITRRVEKLRPLRMRSTSNLMGSVWSPRRMKYDRREWTRRSGSTVDAAA
jgi:hypothetical protein